MVMYGYVWQCSAIFTAVYGYVGLCTVVYGYAWVCRAMYGCVWLCMAMRGYVGLCTAVNGSASTGQQYLSCACFLPVVVSVASTIFALLFG